MSLSSSNFPTICIILVGCHLSGLNGESPFTTIASKAELYSLPALTFGYADLEPFFDEATLHAHYDGHHETYRKKMNSALSEWRESDPLDSFSTEPILEILKNLNKVPENFRNAIKNSGGGFVNHALYWACMSPNPTREIRQPTGALLQDIENEFGSFVKFSLKFTDRAVSLFGSGYVWLSRNPSSGALIITTTVNQDSPISDGLHPILVIDVWEHSYYLKHQFRRHVYVADWWKVVDWENVEELDKWWREVGSYARDEL
ncbi:hypothetical protein CAPTEDRAFT_229194 [Capitella teleta]|uniref:Superoxide dismutase n=1 Tax=Capitella teleta TaxID=283909 RepID=R7TYG3_CAPTE|nr:hypothetical protein CAPTEDRAFT_229194 [Capitella teleta]|eukprot:ELT98943.1 hypothetical protein CAPTEDRAFT_229194 [Capitella teleta]